MPVTSFMNTDTARVVSVIGIIVNYESVPGRIEERPVVVVISIHID